MQINRGEEKEHGRGVLAPDTTAMSAQLRAMFDDLPQEVRDGLVELSWTDKGDGKLRHSKLFPVSKLGQVVETAARVNAVAGQSAYVGAALRRPKTPRWRRAGDAHFYAASCLHADFDGPGDLERAESLCRKAGIEASFKVYTGRHPHERAQLWWRLTAPLTDPDAYREHNRAIAEALGGDPTVVNPGRVMRLAGTIAWPRKKGRIVELTEFVLLEGGG